MKQLVLVVTILMLASPLARADSYSISDNNSALKFTRDDANINLAGPSDPVQLPRTIEWTVDGRRILVYPSSPANFVDVGHIHPGAHVRANQIHAQGPMLGYATSATEGTVTGGFVYSLDGGAMGSGISRISEKVDIHNKTGGDVNVLLTGMGFKPPQANLEVPDFSGISVTGTTTVFIHGNTSASSLTEPPFEPVTVLPVTTFTGFNPLLNLSYNIPAGAYLVMVTELRVAPAPLTLTILGWLVAVIFLVAAGTMLARRRSKRPG
jgi:hypothetical protein